MKHCPLFLFVFLSVLLLSPEAPACTTAIVSAGASETGRPLLWKQRDTGNPFNTAVFIHATDSNFAYTGIFNVGDSERKAVYAGENERGFAIVNNVSYNLASGQYASKNGSFMRRALERCVTVDDFDAMLRSENPRNVEANFGVIDASGGAAYFEAADSSVTRFDVPEGGWLVRANFSLSGTSEGQGYARYVTAQALMSAHRGKFSPLFLIDGLGRSYYNAVLGYDASTRFPKGMAYDEDFIPRPTTVSSVCFDGSACMWAAVGYTPASYAMPLSICSELPSCLEEANSFAQKLKRQMHPSQRDAGVKYIDFGVARRIMKVVRRYEKEAAALLGDNDALDRLFERFAKEFE